MRLNRDGRSRIRVSRLLLTTATSIPTVAAMATSSESFFFENNMLSIFLFGEVFYLGDSEKVHVK